ncbi:hypothetical protein [Cellvibrio sp. pealriver]|uniref:hypothetical protein n=1 Tax=Cellvibrio sp. pealriver TaxID=1622269 RepID=UPI00066FED20|nr:hypothetical protein [Cellvibrio sp. pealriver]
MTKKHPPVQITKPETFIIESLSLDDEASERLEGKILYNILKMQGKNPIYYYFRTHLELVKLAELFRESGYRYLHLSCHGNTESLVYTFSHHTFTEFSNIFSKKLNNRRLFISGCSMGNKKFASELYSTNGGMYSVIAPTKDVYFEQTTSFWPAFYYMMHAYDANSMGGSYMKQVLKRLSWMFEIPLALYFKNTGKGGIVDEVLFSGDNKLLYRAVSKSSPLEQKA